MRRIATDTLPGLDNTTQRWVYNGLDCSLTKEIHTTLGNIALDFDHETIYAFERAMQAPALEMSMRGIRIDISARDNEARRLELVKKRTVGILNELAHEVWGKGLNANSPVQLQNFLYGYLGLPPVMGRKSNGKFGPTTNREALEKLRDSFIYPKPFINCVMHIRDLVKQLAVLNSGIDPDGRMRCSYNVAGTDTGRWSSNKNAWGSGTNTQNITDSMRRMFIADPGMKMCYMDLAQAESRLVGLLAFLRTGEHNYLDACESGDLHTEVAKMVWPTLAWTGDQKKDRKIADQIFYREFSYRDMSKRGGHATNYYGKAQTVAGHLKVSTPLIKAFQDDYFEAFPEIRKQQQGTIKDVQIHGQITTPLGRTRIFFSRPTDDATFREAIAHSPQSSVGDILNLGLYRLWKNSQRLKVELLAQVHDAILFQYPEELEDEIIPLVMETITVHLKFKGRPFYIPCDAAVGWNWAKYNYKSPDKNPDGLKSWGGHDDRKRQRDPKASMLNRVVC